MNITNAKVFVLNMETMKMEATRMLDQKQNELDQKVEKIDKQERELNNMVQRIIDLGIAPPDYINNEIEQTRKRYLNHAKILKEYRVRLISIVTLILQCGMDFLNSIN